MQPLSFLRTGYRSLLVHKFRSFLSVLGIVCGVMAVMAMISTGEGAKREVLSRIEKMGLKNIYIKQITLTDALKKMADEKNSHGLSLKDVALLQRLTPAITQVGTVLTASLTPVGTGKNITPNIIKCSGNFSDLLGLRTKEGRFISEQDSRKSNLVCVLGGSLALRLGRTGRIGSYIRLNDLLYKVVGILARYDFDSQQVAKLSNENFNNAIMLPVDTHQGSISSALVGDSPPLTRIIVEVDSRKNVESVARLIKRTLTLSHNKIRDYELVVPLELLAQSLATQRVFNLILAVTGGISLLVGGIGIMNIMLATVTERKREIGIRRAVGATENDIAWQFLAESFLLTGSGGLAGLAAGFICVNIIETLAGWPISITGRSMFVPFFLACITGIFFGLYPAMRAAKMDPIQALRTV
jgi:putative ABC transport system permease protein